MFYGQQYNRVVLRFPQFLLDVTDGIAEIGNAVGQQEFELIGWHDYRADIDMAVLEAIADMDERCVTVRADTPCLSTLRKTASCLSS